MSRFRLDLLTPDCGSSAVESNKTVPSLLFSRFRVVIFLVELLYLKNAEGLILSVL